MLSCYKFSGQVHSSEKLESAVCRTGCSGQHTFGTVTHWLPTPPSKNILNVLSAEYLEHNVILTAVCNGKYVYLETGGLALSLTNHESFWKEA